MGVEVRNEIRFLLDGEIVRLKDVPGSQTLLDFLRLDRRLRGTKEGCAEGDCGACTVLVGRPTPSGLAYESVNSCIRFTGSLDGCHVVTVEHLAGEDGKLHPVQQAMVDCHASQCGFCTPGFVMSLYGLWMCNPTPSTLEVEQALQGNLCRCTGYAPIIRAAQAIAADPAEDPLVAERDSVIATLKELRDGKRVEAGTEADRLIVPANADDLADVLVAHPDATIVAGATDVGLWVTKFMREIAPVVFIGGLTDLQGIEEDGDAVIFGAGVSYTESFALIQTHFPQIAPLWWRIGGAQIRNMGTLGGNIANGSPIGDTPPPLIALGASITLRKGSERRSVRLEDFFVAYGKQDRAPGEFVEAVHVPKLAEGDMFATYKISKRRDEDISAACGAFRLRVENGTVTDAVVAFGGMAPTPKRAARTEAALIGQPWSEATIEAAASAMAEDYRPITDMRASAEYRMLAAQNLLRRFYIEQTGGTAQITQGAA